MRLRQVPEPGTGALVDQEVEEWHTHPAYLGEGPAIAQTVYKRICYAKEQDARKWAQQKEKGWKIIIDYLSLDIERDIQRIPQQSGWLRAMSGGCGLRCARSELGRGHHLLQDA